MSTDVLTLAQLLSPSFPVGAFAYSSGLETAIHEGFITDAASLQAWLETLLANGSLRADAVLLNAAYGSSDPIVDASARAFASSSERLLETDLQGAAFCETVLAVWGHDLGRLCYPVAVGRTAAHLNLDVKLATAMYLQASMSNLIAAAMRLVPLGQVDGQKTQTALKPMCSEIAAQLRGATLEDLHNSAWMSDIVAMQHETQYSRVFRS
ncbi:urease accessory protein UreF [Planktotalea sp.]|uniref:urease accessory protein UreF n=1 Tax=Planktotalea sp. TaxID=2029877 RepID=UPI003F6B7716